MKKEAGDIECDIWLLGDSNPKNWESVLDTPLDPRHPARHNIWTSVLDVAQDTLFRNYRQRIDTSLLYIRNAVESPRDKPPSNIMDWEPGAQRKIRGFKAAIRKHQPKLVLTFGAFAFEFARRSLAEQPVRRYSDWGAKQLGEEFRKRIDMFDPTTTNILPLLHVVISRRHFIQAHEQYCDRVGANYFEFVGTQIADKLLEHREALHVWIA